MCSLSFSLSKYTVHLHGIKSLIFFPTMSSSSSYSTSASTVSSPSASSVHLHTFSTTLSLKHTDDNFLVQSQQVLAKVESLNLLSSLESSLTPPQFLPESTIVNPAFLLHRQQDHLLVVWLLASMSTSMLTQMVGLRSTHLI